MVAPTYTLRPSGAPAAQYARDVARLADETIAAGEALRPIVERYAAFVAATGREAVRSFPEYLLEALALGVLWRARSADALRDCGATRAFVDALAAHRRAGGARPRDGSNAWILSLDAPFEPGHPSPKVPELDRLLTWLLASGEYDDEVARLEGWRAYLARRGAAANAELEELVLFATAFEAWSEHALGIYTARVDTFLRDRLPRRRWREDTIQCARRRVEYHLNMLGAEVLNRAWRAAFARCRRHVVVMPGCMRSRDDASCAGDRNGLDLRCTGCAVGCAVRGVTTVARRAGAEAVAVIHGSDFSRFLRSPALQGGDVGIVGIACVPGYLGRGGARTPPAFRRNACSSRPPGASTGATRRSPRRPTSRRCGGSSKRRSPCAQRSRHRAPLDRNGSRGRARGGAHRGGSMRVRRRALALAQARDRGDMMIRATFAALLAVHAAIHLLGFVKGSGIAPVPQLSQPVVDVEYNLHPRRSDTGPRTRSVWDISR
jgi:hypothetical protein